MPYFWYFGRHTYFGRHFLWICKHKIKDLIFWRFRFSLFLWLAIFSCDQIYNFENFLSIKIIFKKFLCKIHENKRQTIPCNYRFTAINVYSNLKYFVHKELSFYILSENISGRRVKLQIPVSNFKEEILKFLRVNQWIFTVLMDLCKNDYTKITKVHSSKSLTHYLEHWFNCKLS
jgi:hypothetical protein